MTFQPASAALSWSSFLLQARIAFVTDVFEFVEKYSEYMKLGLLSGLLALLFAIDVNGQVKSVSVPLHKSGDTTGHYKIQRERIVRMKMRDPLVFRDSFLLRISNESWSVEVISADLKTFGGQRYFFTKQVVPSGGPEGKELLFKTKPMSQSQALAVYEAFKKYSVASIPSERDIAGWPLGADGVSYLIEHSGPSTYSFKSYWEPSSQRYRLKQAEAVDNFVKEVEVKLELATSFLAFLNKLPAGTYQTGGMNVYTNTSKKQKTRK